MNLPLISVIVMGCIIGLLTLTIKVLCKILGVNDDE